MGSYMYYPAWDILLHRVTCSSSEYVFWLTHQAIAWRRGVLKIHFQENSLSLPGNNWEEVFPSLHLPRRARRKKNQVNNLDACCYDNQSRTWTIMPKQGVSAAHSWITSSNETHHPPTHSKIQNPKSSRSGFPSSLRETPVKDSVKERDSWWIVATRIQCPSALIKQVKSWTYCRAQGDSSHAQYFIWGELPIFSGEMTVFLPPCEPWSLRGHFTFDSSFLEKISSQILNKCSSLFVSEYWSKRGWATFSVSLPKDLTWLVVFLRT